MSGSTTVGAHEGSARSDTHYAFTHISLHTHRAVTLYTPPLPPPPPYQPPPPPRPPGGVFAPPVGPPSPHIPRINPPHPTGPEVASPATRWASAGLRGRAQSSQGPCSRVGPHPSGGGCGSGWSARGSQRADAPRRARVAHGSRVASH